MAKSETGPIPNLFAEHDAKRKVTPKPSWENTLGFLSELTFPVDAVKSPLSDDPKNWIPPISVGTRDNVKYYSRRLEIFSRYAGHNETMDEAGRSFGAGRIKVSQISIKTLEDLHKNAQAKLRKKYPIDYLSTDKRLTIEARMRLSRKIGGGQSARVVEALSAGKSSEEVKKIAQEGGNITQVRRVLRGWGLKLPFLQERVRILERFSDLKKKDLTDEDTQALLNKVSHRRYRVLRKAGFIVDLSSFTRSAGFYPSGRDIPRVYEVLDQKKMPIGRFPLEKKGDDGKREILAWYYFIATKDRQKALAILRSSPKLADLLSRRPTK